MWANSAGLLKTLRMGSSLDHLMVKGNLCGFGCEPALCPPGPRSGPLAQDVQTSAPGPVGVRLVVQPCQCSPGRLRPAPRSPPGAARAAQPTSATKAPQNAAQPPPKPVAPASREQRLNIPPSWGRAEPPIARPRPFLLTPRQWLTREISQKSPRGLCRGRYHAANCGWPDLQRHPSARLSGLARKFAGGQVQAVGSLR